jgi:magnesium chelatase family protein
MASVKILSAAVIGLDAEIVEVEADIGTGDWRKFIVVGLPDTAVNESRERVKSAIKNSYFEFPKPKVTVNLAPGNLKKYGPSYDLPIAVSILTAAGHLRITNDLRRCLFIGELSLAGDIRPVNGLLPIALKARQAGIKTLFVPRPNASEAKLVRELEVIPVDNFKQLAKHLIGQELIPPAPASKFDFSNTEHLFDMAHVRGQEHVKRALEIAAAGGHNILMSGSPGAGKTLLARTLPSILPDLTLEEALEITKIYSVAGHLSMNTALVTARPFRSPHHTASGVALVGGGAWPRPGEISLAHRGVLFLDEFPEFPRAVLENLRQPLEDGVIHISRAAGNLTFPAKFILVAAMNPCPCGYAGDREKKCICSPGQIANYRKKISGPILDRIDLHVNVPRIKFDKLNDEKPATPSIEIKKKVEAARVQQRARFKNTPFLTNAEMTTEAIKEFCPTDNASKQLLRNAVDKMNLSARGYFRILKLARTIADLASQEKITPLHISEALQYRPLDN